MALNFLGLHQDPPHNDYTMLDETRCDGTVWWNTSLHRAQCKRCGVNATSFYVIAGTYYDSSYPYIHYINPVFAEITLDIGEAVIPDPENPS